MSHVLITGSTGMVGKGVLLECIKSPAIRSVTLLNRRPVDIADPKVRELILEDFTRVEEVRSGLGIPDACFHCMGVSSVGMSEAEYTGLTFEVTRQLADLCHDLNPGMTFTYVSGTGTDGSGKSRQMWARVKGRTENYILSKHFSRAFMFRPGLILPEDGIRSRTRLYDTIYTILRPFFPLLKRSRSVTTTSRLGRAMIKTLADEVPAPLYLENRDINTLAG